VLGSVQADDDMLTSTGYPRPNTAADTAHSSHSTQPARRPHRATPRVEDDTPAERRPHSIGLCSPLSEGPDPGSAQRHLNAGSPVSRSSQPERVCAYTRTQARGGGGCCRCCGMRDRGGGGRKVCMYVCKDSAAPAHAHTGPRRHARAPTWRRHHIPRLVRRQAFHTDRHR